MDRLFVILLFVLIGLFLNGQSHVKHRYITVPETPIYDIYQLRQGKWPSILKVNGTDCKERSLEDCLTLLTKNRIRSSRLRSSYPKLNRYLSGFSRKEISEFSIVLDNDGSIISLIEEHHNLESISLVQLKEFLRLIEWSPGLSDNIPVPTKFQIEIQFDESICAIESKYLLKKNLKHIISNEIGTIKGNLLMKYEIYEEDANVYNHPLVTKDDLIKYENQVAIKKDSGLMESIKIKDEYEEWLSTQSEIDCQSISLKVSELTQDYKKYIQKI